MEILKKVVERNIYIATCPKCGKKMKGTSKTQIEFNTKIHQLSKSCINDTNI